MIARTFTDFVQALVEGTAVEKKSQFVPKLYTVEFCRKNDMPHAQLLGLYDSPADIPFDRLPDQCVLKPNRLASSKGVFLLVRNGKNWRSLLGKENVDEDEIVDRLGRACDGSGDTKILCECLIVGENGPTAAPFDYKFYVFDGTVALIEQTNRGCDPTEICFFDGQFNPLESNKVVLNRKYVSMGRHKTPKNSREMLSIASKCSFITSQPFVRVDLYTSGSRAFVGELTPAPGGAYFGRLFRFSEDYDRALGDLWMRAYVSRGWKLPVISRRAPVHFLK